MSRHKEITACQFVHVLSRAAKHEKQKQVGLKEEINKSIIVTQHVSTPFSIVD